MSRFIANVSLLVIASFVSLSVAELILRATIERPLHRKEPEVRYDPHPVRRFTLRPNQLAFSYGAKTTVDAHGFRSNGSEQASRSASSPILLALGDSFTFGLGVGDSETWPAVLEAELRRQLTDDVRVLNLGTISYGVFHELDLLLGKGLVQRPDIVVHALYWNDYMSAAPPAADDPTVLTEEGYFVWDRSRASATRPYLIDMMGRSAVLSALKEAVDRAFPRADQSMTGYGRAYRDLLTSGLTRAQWDLISNFYRQLKALGAQEGFVPFAVVLPVVDIVAGHSPSSHPYAIQVRRMLQDTEVPYLDALSLWAERGLGGETFLPQGPDAHLNANGYSVLADAIAHALLSEPATASKLH